MSYAWDLNGDGAFGLPGQEVLFSAANIQGPRTVTVAVEATDSAGLTTRAQTTLTVTGLPVSFEPAVNYVVPSNPQSVAIGDINTDTIPDLITADEPAAGNSLSILTGTGIGTFYSAMSYYAPGRAEDVTLADLNGDSHLDIITAFSGSRSVKVLLSEGYGAFQNPVNYNLSGYPHSIALGDLNNDGKLDLVTPNSRQ